jgi:DNA polymerase-3 subunit epsilon
VWWDRAVAAGFVPQEAVRPETTFVVAADVDSLSVKARAAREFNVPIISADDFRRLLPADQPKLHPTAEHRAEHRAEHGAEHGAELRADGGAGHTDERRAG